jgi:manganese/zinc/iron transport system substrate-binding protein
VVNGLHLEGKMAEMLEKFSREKSVIVLADGIAERDKIKTTDFGDSYDPHIWFDPMIWRDGLEHVKEELIKLDSSKRKIYHENFKNYEKQILETDAWVKDHLANIHESSKILITSHDAFSYFGRRYGIEVKGIQGVSTLSEVGLRDISNMVDFVIAKQIKSIFVETSTSNKTAQAIVAGTAQKGYHLSIDGPLYSDALGEPGAPAGTYLGMLKENVKMIVKGLK